MDMPSVHRNYLVLLHWWPQVRTHTEKGGGHESRQECRSTVLTCVEWSAYFQVTNGEWSYSHSVAGGVSSHSCVWTNNSSMKRPEAIIYVLIIMSTMIRSFDILPH
jgi:hypothetical protein